MEDNGYTKLPNGLIIQWGTAFLAAGDGGSSYISFPVAFSKKCFAVTTSIKDNYGAVGDMTFQVTNCTTNGFTAIKQTYYGGFNPPTAYGYYIAIGY